MRPYLATPINRHDKGGLSSSKSVLMYSHDSYCLGHLRRNTNIASLLTRAAPDSTALLLADCASSGVFEMPKGVDLIKLPSLNKTGADAWEPKGLRISQQMTKDLRAGLIETAARAFKPDLFLVDHRPAGVWGDLLPTLEMLRCLPQPPKIVLGLRDIMDSPEKIQMSWRHDGIYDVIAKYYDSIFIYGSAQVYDAAALYGLNNTFHGEIHYCGYVHSDEAYLSQKEAHEHLEIEAKKLLLVTAGGGGHEAFPVMARCLDALRSMAPADRPEAIFITGPLMENADRENLIDLAHGLPVRVLTFASGFLNYLSAADLVITMGGYNTLMESISMRKRTVIVSRAGLTNEQKIRAEAFARLGIIETCALADTTPETLAKTIRRNLDAGPIPHSGLNLEGLGEAVNHIKRMLGLQNAPHLSNENHPQIRKMAAAR